MAGSIEVLDGTTPITLSFDDLVKYHGRNSIAGLAIGFKALECGMPLLSPGEPPNRREVEVAVAFNGDGARDAFEMVTRAVTEDRYSVVPELAGPGAPEAPTGHFVFRLSYRNRVVDLTLRPGLVGEDFNACIRAGPQTPEEEGAIARMKEDVAEALLALPADEVYQASSSSG